MNISPELLVAVMSAVLFAAMGIDKNRAKKGGRRISEKLLFTLAILGGGIGGWLGMQVFRHKTKHWYFKFGFLIIAVVQIVALYYCGIV